MHYWAIVYGALILWIYISWLRGSRAKRAALAAKQTFIARVEEYHEHCATQIKAGR